MRFIHTFYSKPLLKNKFDNYEALVGVIISNYTYSAYCIHRLGYQIILYADKIGGEILSNIPYDEIKIIDFNESADFAASIKFEAIKDMGPDDIHIDGDLFIQKPDCIKLIDEYKDYDFIFSFFEENQYIAGLEKYRRYYNKMLSKFRTKAELFTEPYILPTDVSQLKWPNTSFMKFNNMELKKEYVRQYKFFINAFRDVDFEETWPDLFFEQYHMMQLVNYYGYKYKEMVTGYPTDEANDYALEIGFTHLGTVKMEYTQDFNDILKDLSPETYEEMLKQIEKYQHNKPKED